jgi:hypothetical protein
MQTMDNDTDGNAATQTMGNDADNNNALQHRRQGEATTSQKRVVVALVRARAATVALTTMVALAAARLVVVAATVTVPVAAARLVAVDLYVSGHMLESKENLNSMLSSSPLFVVVGLVLLNDTCR